MRKNVIQRRELVEQLFQLGFSESEISRMIGRWNRATNWQDLAGLQENFPNRPTKKNEVFATVISYYAALLKEQSDNWRSKDAPKSQLRDLLGEWLDFSGNSMYLRGVSYVLFHLSLPSYPRERQGYVNLLKAMYGWPISDPCSQEMAESFEAKAFDWFLKWWFELFCAIAEGKEVVPNSREQLQQMLVRQALSDQRREIIPIWDNQVFSLMDKMLEVLSERRRFVVSKRCGIGCQPLTYAQIGKELDVSRERTRQLWTEALRKLRNEATHLNLHVYGQSFGKILCELQVTRAEVEELKHPTKKEKAEGFIFAKDVAFLCSKIDGIIGDELSSCVVRAQNSCAMAGIKFLGDLVQMTEEKLLNIKNVGRKTIKELKRLLANHGLSLNMSSDDPRVMEFNRKRSELDRAPLDIEDVYYE